MFGIITSLFALSLVVITQVGNVYIANGIYYLYITLLGKFKIANRWGLYFYFAFIMCFAISILNYVLLLGGRYEIRFLVQFLFTFQYLIFFIEIKINTRKFEKFFISYSFAYAILIIAFFLLKVNLDSSLNFFIHDRMWGSEYFNGWPNSVGLPLIFALFLYFSSSDKLMKNWFPKATLLLACIATTSRTSIAGCVLVILYFSICPRGESIKRFLRKRLYIIAAVAFLTLIIIARLLDEQSILGRLLYSKDRFELIRVTGQLLAKSPVFGFGGVTLDVLIEKYGILVLMKYQHTHSFPLEIGIRYGLLGFVSFMGMLICMYQKLRLSDNKFIFLLLWFLALFQIFVRDFVFLYLISFICYRDRVTSASSAMGIVKASKLMKREHRWLEGDGS